MTAPVCLGGNRRCGCKWLGREYACSRQGWEPVRHRAPESTLIPSCYRPACNYSEWPSFSRKLSSAQRMRAELLRRCSPPGETATDGSWLIDMNICKAVPLVSRWDQLISTTYISEFPQIRLKLGFWLEPQPYPVAASSTVSCFPYSFYPKMLSQ